MWYFGGGRDRRTHIFSVNIIDLQLGAVKWAGQREEGRSSRPHGRILLVSDSSYQVVVTTDFIAGKVRLRSTTVECVRVWA